MFYSAIKGRMMKNILLTIFSGFAVIFANPCNKGQYKDLPFADLRFVHNTLQASDIPIEDRLLEEGWYRAGDEDMPTTLPSPMSCGTKVPIWMDGTIPTVAEQIVSRTVRVGGYPDTYPIKVKNCGQYRVYHLVPTGGIEEGYCFGEGENGTRPDFLPSATVEVDVLEGEYLSVYTANCLCNTCNNETLLFQVTWYIDGDFLMSLPPQQYQSIGRIELDEKESSLHRMGRRLSCSIRARHTPKGPPGPSTISPELFMGLEVLTPVVDIAREDGKGVIRFRPTVPIGCTLPNDACTLRIVMRTHNDSKCEELGIPGDSDCGVVMTVTDWGKEYNMEVAAKVTTAYGFTKVFEVTLAVLGLYRPHRIWSNYELLPIKVIVKDKEEPLADRNCYARNDPHMKTFDNIKYDIQYKGTFVLYRHKKHSMQVQAHFETCRGGRPHCVCGVAVQAGRDVFVFNRCSGFFDYTFCEDNVLDVRRDPYSSRKFKIYLPTGTMIEVSDNNCCGEFATISVRPSPRDFDASEGLCGTVNHNPTDDFKMSDGNSAPNADTFSRSWRIKDAGEVNLFEIETNTFSHWGQENEICTCLHNSTSTIAVLPKIHCEPGMVPACRQNERQEKKIDLCKVHKIPRTKRSLRSMEEGRRRRDAYYRKKKKRSTNRTNMDRQQAIDYCTRTLSQSASFNLCAKVPNVNISDAIDICVMDILLTNTTDWTDAARESLKDECLGELQMNTTLQEKGPDGSPSVADMVSEITCPNECSGIGNCTKGKCICPEGFGGSDCSVDLSIPPFFDALMDDGLCDKQHWACDSAMALGDEFVAIDTMKCNMKPFQIDKTGQVSEEEEKIVPADVQTMMSLFCPFPIQRRKRDTEQQRDRFVMGFNVSLSNDGIHFGDMQQLFIFDSQCQSHEADGATYRFFLKSGYCFIDNQCMAEGDVDPDNDCHICDPIEDLYNWSLRKDTVCIPVKLQSDETSSYLWVIGPVGGVVVACVVIGLIIWRMKMTKMRKVKDSNIFRQPSLETQKST